MPPLSLYIHIPWCVRKCPYCDFNSHAAPNDLPVEAYLEALLMDLQAETCRAGERQIQSIFIGGGTPSLFPAAAFETLLSAVDNQLGIAGDAEITLEANPGTAERGNFAGLRRAGINRLSIGVQSFDDEALQKLGRIHNSGEAEYAYRLARDAGFENINLDLMHGLPGQSTAAALEDLHRAITLEPDHISWYQLTIEPNTAFYSAPPVLPPESILETTFERGRTLLENAGFHQYEISAYARNNKRSQHNLNYWQFGDYLALGAGAHGKITTPDGRIARYQKTRLPRDYMDSINPVTVQETTIDRENLPLEFMMNALRLIDGVEVERFAERTGLPLTTITPILKELREKALLEANTDRLQTTTQGALFLNDVLEAFLPR